MLRAKSADSKSADDAGGGESEAPPKYDIMSNEESAFDSVAKKSNGLRTTQLMSRRLISLGLALRLSAVMIVMMMTKLTKLTMMMMMFA